MSNRPYLVQLSNKRDIEIDTDELNIVMSAIEKGTMAKVRRGFINPSFIVSIVPDKDRWEKHMGRMQIYGQGIHYNSGEFEKAKREQELKGCPKLKEAFPVREEIEKLRVKMLDHGKRR